MTNPLTEKLRPHVDAIKRGAEGGDARAREVITLYRMHCDCPSDPGAFALCGAAFDEWLNRHEQTSKCGEQNRSDTKNYQSRY